MSRREEDDPMDFDRWSEALSWRAILHDAKEEDLTNAVGREWQSWYSDAENRGTFDAVTRMFADSASYRKRARPEKAELDADQYDLSVPIAEWQRRRTSSAAPGRRSFTGAMWWLLAGGMAATLVAIAALVFLMPLRLWLKVSPSHPVVYETGVGNLQDAHLRDGSSIVLGGRTKLSVAFSAQRRSVRLIEGEAWFRVAHNAHWPFVVTVGGSTITDVGTAFVVTLDSDRVFVTVTEGAVAVSGPQSGLAAPGVNQSTALSPAALAPIHVTRGEELSVGNDGALGPVKPADPHAATAWIHGRLIFYDMPLRYVVEAVDRYSSRHIVIGSSAGVLRFGGVVYDDQIEDWLKSLEAIFPVTVKDQGADVRIEMRHSPPATGELSSQPQP